MTIELFLLYALFGVLGFAAHILKTMKQTANTWDMSVLAYLSNYPKQTALAAIGFIGAMAGFYELEQLNMTTAFAAGYMANSAADVLTGRTIKVMR